MIHAVITGAYYPPVCTCMYMEDFDYRSILVDSVSILHCFKTRSNSAPPPERVLNYSFDRPLTASTPISLIDRLTALAEGKY